MDQVTPAMTAEVRMIRAAERAAIVAWLRTLPAMQHPGALAAAIERGEHLRPREHAKESACTCDWSTESRIRCPLHGSLRQIGE